MSEVSPWAAIKDDPTVAVALEYEGAVVDGLRVFRSASTPKALVSAIDRFLGAHADWGRMPGTLATRVGVLICERDRVTPADIAELMARIDRAGEMAKASRTEAMASGATPC